MTAQKKFGILIADDHELIRRGVRSLLANQSQMFICGEAASGKEAVEQALKLKPDVVILDVSMPVMNGLDAAREIKRLTPATKVVILTMHDSNQMRADARAVGADAYLPKMEAAEKLLDIVRFLLGIRTETVGPAVAVRTTRRVRPDTCGGLPGLFNFEH